MYAHKFVQTNLFHSDKNPTNLNVAFKFQVLGVGCGNSRLEDNLLWWGVAAAGGTCIDRLAGNEEMLP